MTSALNSPIIYIMVVGFHHKKGCQVEFVYPETNLIRKLTDKQAENSIELYSLPKKWRHLPSLALPDGSHNYTSDYIYFHLENDTESPVALLPTLSATATPSAATPAKPKTNPNKTLFGLSCYRQMNADELIYKDVDVTRNTLQKSVCILSTCPMYASSIRFKLHAITCAYFEQKDFSKTQLLVDAFNSTLRVNSATLSDYSINSLNSCDNYMCLSLGDLVLRYQHKILVLFKLLLLQKKCLFQIKPVSSLSNTIISLVSLIPDLLQSNKNGLDYCSGFFDSIDLINCELERKAQKRTAAASSELSVSLKHPASTPMLKGRKKLKSSMKKSATKSTASCSSSASSSSSNSSPSVSISSSPVSMASSNFSSQSSSSQPQTQQQQQQQQKNTQKKNLVFDPTASSSSLINNLNANNCLIVNDENYYFNKNLQSLNLNEKSNKQPQLLDEQPRLSVFKKAESNSQIESIKSKVFKFVDWSSSTSSSGNSTPNSHQGKLIKSSSSSHITPSKQNSRYNIFATPHSSSSQDDTIDEEDTRKSDEKKSTTAINIEDLLKLDFGMPLKLFSQFNILHPYLSLYYLDYFTMINKMNTKLYCTTTLMMSMMSQANSTVNSNNNKEQKNSNESLALDGGDSSESVTYSSSSILSSTSASATSAPGTYGSSSSSCSFKQNQQQSSTSYGYTIGATNILFKQRLYDDLDVFIDETNIDTKQNDSLKKQLQLSTADLRFADYIIKQVNMARNNSSSCGVSRNTPTLLSIKKTSSINNLDKNSEIQLATSSSSSSSFEGSDDWIRLHFKWYLYNMLGSIVKEELCSEIRNELESELVKLNQIEQANNIACSSSNSSTLSLATASAANGNNTKIISEVVDIDEYIDKISTPSLLSTNTIESNNYTEIKIKKKKTNKLKLSRKNSSSHSLTNSSTLSSINNSYQSQEYTYSNYTDDYNLNFLNEFKQTDCFSEWYNTNRSQLEATLFKPDEETESMKTNLTRLDYLMRRLRQLDDIGLAHPFNGQMGVNDIKLKFNFLFTTTESGRKLNKALVDTGKMMNSTGKAVGEVFSHAKSTFSSFLSNWSSPSSSSMMSPLSSPATQVNSLSVSNASSKSSKSK